MKKIYCFIIMFFINTIYVHASYSVENKNFDADISKILNNLKSPSFKSNQDKLAYLNKIFINKPYEFNALGEGKYGEFDDYPLYRTDTFDCETYVDTLIALDLATDLQSFKDIMIKIRYKNGNVSFVDRNHFTCLDWNTNNQKQNITHDITHNIKLGNKDITKDANTYIDKPNWYKNLTVARVRLKGLDEDEKNKKLADLRAQGVKFKKELSTISYIPLDKIFPDKDNIDMRIINQIPNGSIIEIVKLNPELYKIIGTNLNISHLGFVIWENEKPFFIHASSDKQMVVKNLLVEYLKKAKSTQYIEGINVQVIN